MKFQKSHNHQLGGGYLYQWWLTLFLDRILKKEISFRSQGKIIKKRSQLQNQKLAILQSKKSTEEMQKYLLMQGAFRFQELLSNNGNLPNDEEQYIFVEGEDSVLEDINVINHDKLYLIQAKSSAKKPITATTIRKTILKFLENKNYQEIIKKIQSTKKYPFGYIPRKILNTKITFILATNTDLDNKNQFLTEILSKKRKARDNISNLIMAILGEIQETRLQANGRKKKQTKYSISTHLSILPKNSIQQLLTHFTSQKLSKINPIEKMIKKIHPELFDDTIQIIMLLENTLAINNLNFYALKQSTKNTFQTNKGFLEALHDTIELCTSGDTPNTEQKRLAKDFKSVFFHSKKSGELQKQGKFLL